MTGKDLSYLNSLIITPVILVFITTNKCTAACENCCFKCNPQKKDHLSFVNIKEHIDSSINSFHTIKIVVLTGGECFTLGKDLFEAIKYIKTKGLTSRIVTNAYWATNFKITFRTILLLHQCGLDELNISTGDEHLKWIPMDNIIYVIVASILLDISLVVNIESAEIKNFTKETLLNDIRLRKYDMNKFHNVVIINGRWVYFDQNEDIGNKELTYGQATKNRCTSLFNTLTISPKGEVMSCCGITVMGNKHLFMGYIGKYSIKELYYCQFDDFLKIWLFTEGPMEILNFCRKLKNKKPISKNIHGCQVCASLFSNAEYMDIIKNNYGIVFQRVIMKYHLLRKKYLKQYNKDYEQNKQQKESHYLKYSHYKYFDIVLY